MPDVFGIEHLIAVASQPKATSIAAIDAAHYPACAPDYWGSVLHRPGWHVARGDELSARMCNGEELMQIGRPDIQSEDSGGGAMAAH